MELRIGDALNLREKRRIVNALRDKWHHHHNVSVAEAADYADHPQHAVMGVALMGNDARQVESALSRLVEHVRNERQAELMDYRIEIIASRD